MARLKVFGAELSADLSDEISTWQGEFDRALSHLDSPVNGDHRAKAIPPA